MRSTFLSRTRRWIGASALAVIIGLSGGASFFVATSQHATADVTATTGKVQNAAQITAPSVTAPVSFADLVDTVKPAVVSIVVEAQGQDASSDDSGSFNNQIPDLPDDSPLKNFFDQFRRHGQMPQQKPHKYMAAGSGFAISADGYFVTNNHVVKDASKVTVQFSNGDEKPATIVGTDAKTDLAVIKVSGLTDQPFVKLADTPPRVGDWVMAVGNPFGLGGTVTAGIVSALDRDIGGNSDDSYMQIDAAVNSGNSGGPDFNLKGEVVGVNTAIFSPNGGSVGIAFAIPASTVKRITTDLIKTGTVTRGFLGVGIQDVTHDIADSVGLKTAKGALVTEVNKDTPAERADTKDKSTKKPAPDENSTAPVQSSVGLTLVPNSDGPGLLIQDIDPDSVAASKGFEVGDTILMVDKKDVNSAKAFQSAIDAVKSSGRSTALIKAERDGNPRYIGLPLSDK